MKPMLRILLICLLAPTALAWSQDNPLSTFNKRFYERTKTSLLRSAEKVPEADYAFQPTPEVRTFGQILGHVADAQYLFCSIALGEKNPGLNIEKTKTSKADLTAALKDAFAYCDKAYDSMTDATGTQMVKFFGNDAPKLGLLSVNNAHNMEHYGNLVTYMRIKGIVPPTSEAASQPKPDSQPKMDQPKPDSQPKPQK